VSFFELPPRPPEPDEPETEDFERPDWQGPPANVLGTPVPLRLVLARTDDVAIAVTDLVAFPTGCEFKLVIRSRRRTHEIDNDPLGMFPVDFGRWRRAEELPDDLLRFGVHLSDGTKATSLDEPGWDPDPETTPEPPVLSQSGGAGGGGGDFSYGFWLWPLPPPGPLALVCEWPERGIALERTEIDAGVILEAAQHVETLWEDGGGSGPTSRFVNLGP
jgi:hypothetical protein